MALRGSQVGIVVLALALVSAEPGASEPPATRSGGGEDLEATLDRLWEESARLGALERRLVELSARYGSLDDVSGIAEERVRLRRDLEEGANGYRAELDRLLLNKSAALVAGIRSALEEKRRQQLALGDLKAYGRLERDGVRFREFEARLRVTLGNEATAHAERLRRLEALRARRRATLRAAAGSAAALLVLALALWRRRAARPRTPPPS